MHSAARPWTKDRVITHRRVVAVSSAIFGLFMLVRPDDWRTALFEVPFGLAPRWFWGVSFLAAGSLKALRRRPWTAFFLGSVIGAWVLCLVWAVARGYVMDGAPPGSPVGWLWPATACLMLFIPETDRKR